MSYSTGTLDVDLQAFREGREFRIAHEFNLDDTSNLLIIRVDVNSAIVLTKSALEVDQGNARYSVNVGGVVTGSLDTPIQVLRKSDLTGTPVVAPEITFTPYQDGAVITGGIDSPIARARTGSGKSTSTNVAEVSERRGFSPKTLYLVIQEIEADTNDTTGILNLEWIKV